MRSEAYRTSFIFASSACGVLGDGGGRFGRLKGSLLLLQLLLLERKCVRHVGCKGLWTSSKLKRVRVVTTLAVLGES